MHQVTGRRGSVRRRSAAGLHQVRPAALVRRLQTHFHTVGATLGGGEGAELGPPPYISMRFVVFALWRRELFAQEGPTGTSGSSLCPRVASRRRFGGEGQCDGCGSSQSDLCRRLRDGISSKRWNIPKICVDYSLKR